MDTVDASIPLQATNQFDLSKMMSLAEMSNKLRMENQQIQSQNALKQVFMNPGSLDDQGNPTPQTIQKTMAIDPKLGTDLRDSNIAAQAQKWHTQLTQTQLGKLKADTMTGIAAAGVTAYNDAIANGKSPQEAAAEGAAARNTAATQNGGTLQDDEVSRITGTPFQLSQAQVLANLNPDYVASQEKKTEFKFKQDKDTRDDRAEVEREKHDRASEEHLAQIAANASNRVGQPKLEPGMQWNAESLAKGEYVEEPMKGGTKAGIVPFTPRMGDIMASLAAKGIPLPTAYRSREQQAKLYDGLDRKYPDKSADEIAEIIGTGAIDFGAEKKETQVAAGQAGKIQVAQNEIKEFIPLVREASKKVPRGQFVPANKLLQMVDSSISDPNLKALKIRLNALMNAYDVLGGRGGTDQVKREEAHKLISSADSPEALESAMESLSKEATAAEAAAEKASKRRQPAAKDPDAIYARDPQGNLHQAKKGTPLPAGWKAE